MHPALERGLRNFQRGPCPSPRECIHLKPRRTLKSVVFLNQSVTQRSRRARLLQKQKKKARPDMEHTPPLHHYPFLDNKAVGRNHPTCNQPRLLISRHVFFPLSFRNVTHAYMHFCVVAVSRGKVTTGGTDSSIEDELRSTSGGEGC